MEQNKTIEEQSKNLGKLEENKAKTEMKLSTMKSELQNQQLRARDEIQQTQRLLNTQSSAITELTHTEKQVQNDINTSQCEIQTLNLMLSNTFSLQLLDFHAVVSQMLGIDSTGCIPNCEVLRRLEVLIQSCRCHCAAHLHHKHQLQECPDLFINAAHPLESKSQALPSSSTAVCEGRGSQRANDDL